MNYYGGKKQLEQKFKASVKEYDLEKLNAMKAEVEIDDKFNYFCNKIIKIILSNINLLEEYKKSEYINILKISDNIKRAMKKFIINTDVNTLKILVEFKDSKKLKLYNCIENAIIIETEKNIESFIKNFKKSKEAQILEIIAKIKTKFDEAFFPQEFHINDIDEMINEKMIDFKFKDNEKDEINNIAMVIFKDELKFLINNELKNIN